MMFELSDNEPECVVQEAEYIRLLGFPRQRTLEDRSRALASWAQGWFKQHGKPWIYARQVQDVEVAETHFRISGTEFHSLLVQRQFAAANATHAFLIAVSAGRECEEHARELWQDGKPDEYFFLEVYASAVVEQLIAVTHGRICGWADQQGLAVLPYHSPGNSGWSVADQVKLGNVLRAEAQGALPGELTVLESGMLCPKKSQLALVGVTPDHEGGGRFKRLVPCGACVLPQCRFRRAPHKPADGPAWL
jgi:hypothetical protein